MMRKMTKEEAVAWKKRWEQANQFEIEELRRTPPATRYLQFLNLMRMAFEFEWTDNMQSGIEEVRQRWKRLREHYIGKKASPLPEETEGDPS